MSKDEFRKLIAAAGLADARKGEVAAAIGRARSHVYRWLSGETPISEANALLIRSKLKPKTAKKRKK